MIITKYKEGGGIDTDSLLSRIQDDESLYKDGEYTKKGKKYSEGLSEIKELQEQGFSYENDEDDNFVIKDSTGAIVDDRKMAGRGQRVNSLFSTRKRKAVSKLVGAGLAQDVKKPINLGDDVATEYGGINLNPVVDVIPGAISNITTTPKAEESPNVSNGKVPAVAAPTPEEIAVKKEKAAAVKAETDKRAAETEYNKGFGEELTYKYNKDGKELSNLYKFNSTDNTWHKKIKGRYLKIKDESGNRSKKLNSYFNLEAGKDEEPEKTSYQELIDYANTLGFDQGALDKAIRGIDEEYFTTTSSLDKYKSELTAELKEGRDWAFQNTGVSALTAAGIVVGYKASNPWDLYITKDPLTRLGVRVNKNLNVLVRTVVSPLTGTSNIVKSLVNKGENPVKLIREVSYKTNQIRFRDYQRVLKHQKGLLKEATENFNKLKPKDPGYKKAKSRVVNLQNQIDGSKKKFEVASKNLSKSASNLVGKVDPSVIDELVKLDYDTLKANRSVEVRKLNKLKKLGVMKDVVKQQGVVDNISNALKKLSTKSGKVGSNKFNSIYNKIKGLTADLAKKPINKLGGKAAGNFLGKFAKNILNVGEAHMLLVEWLLRPSNSHSFGDVPQEKEVTGINDLELEATAKLTPLQIDRMNQLGLKATDYVDLLEGKYKAEIAGHGYKTVTSLLSSGNTVKQREWVMNAMVEAKDSDEFTAEVVQTLYRSLMELAKLGKVSKSGKTVNYIMNSDLPVSDFKDDVNKLANQVRDYYKEKNNPRWSINTPKYQSGGGYLDERYKPAGYDEAVALLEESDDVVPPTQLDTVVQYIKPKAANPIAVKKVVSNDTGIFQDTRALTNDNISGVLSTWDSDGNDQKLSGKFRQMSNNIIGSEGKLKTLEDVQSAVNVTLAAEEGFRSKAYGDVGQQSVGFGINSKFIGSDTVSAKDGWRYMVNHRSKIVTKIQSKVPEIDPKLAEVLSAFIYNVGDGYIDTSTLFKKLRQNPEISNEEISNELLKFTKVSGTYNKATEDRRKRTIKLLNKIR